MAEIVSAPQGEELLIEIFSVQAIDRNPVPDGYYDVVIKQCVPGKSKAGHPKWGLQLAVENHEEFNNKPLFDTISFAPNAMEFTKEKLMILAPELTSDPDRKIQFSADAARMIGRKGRVRVTTGEWEGRPKNDVKEWVPLEGGAFLAGV